MELNFVDNGIDLENFDKDAEIAKFSDIKSVGWNLTVRLYTTPVVTKGGIFLSNHDDEFVNCVGLVVEMSPHAYKDARYDQTGPWCKIGDWVVFPRHNGVKYFYKKMAVFDLKEDQILKVVEDPRNVTRK